MANDLPIDQLAGSKKMMLAALLQRMNQPNPSLGGNIGNALAMGLMGMYEGQDEKQMLNLAIQKDAASKAAVDRAIAPAPAPVAPAPVSETPPISKPAMVAALSPDLDAKIQAVAKQIGVEPSAVRSVLDAESNGGDPNAMSPGKGTYRGVTQIGPQTFSEAPGGRLAGMTFDEFKGAPATRQLDAYPAYLDQYKFKDQLAQNGINLANLPPDKQFAVLQGMQFSPNGQGWKQAFAQGNYDVPVTNAPQSPPLGNTSINAMARSPYGQNAVALARPVDPNGQPMQPQQAPPQQVAQGPVAPQVPANAPAQLPVPQELQEYERNAQIAKQKGDGKAYQFWVQQATAAREGYLKSLQDIQVEQQKKLNVPPEKFTYDGREFTRELRSGKITEITPQSAQGTTLNTAQAKERSDLRQEIMTTPQFKNIAQVAPVYKSMLDAAKTDNRAADLNLVYGLAKLMDPGSVVREGEVGMAQAVATLPVQLQAAIMSQLQGTGRLAPEVRQALMDQAHSRIQAYNSEYENASQLYGRVGAQRGFKQEDIAPSFGPFEKYSPAAPATMPNRDQAVEILRRRMQQQGR